MITLHSLHVTTTAYSGDWLQCHFWGMFFWLHMQSSLYRLASKVWYNWARCIRLVGGGSTGCNYCFSVGGCISWQEVELFHSIHLPFTFRCLILQSCERDKWEDCAVSLNMELATLHSPCLLPCKLYIPSSARQTTHRHLHCTSDHLRSFLFCSPAGHSLHICQSQEEAAGQNICPLYCHWSSSDSGSHGCFTSVTSPDEAKQAEMVPLLQETKQKTCESQGWGWSIEKVYIDGLFNIVIAEWNQTCI